MGYQVKLIDRIRELGLEDKVLTDISEFSYKWSEGYETFNEVTHSKEIYGGSTYSGTYHPNVHCEGEGICDHCGRTLW